MGRSGCGCVHWMYFTASVEEIDSLLRNSPDSSVPSNSSLTSCFPLSLHQDDRDPRFRERAAARNSILDQYGKILPRVQRKLAVERAKPYRLPSSLLREGKFSEGEIEWTTDHRFDYTRLIFFPSGFTVARPKPLSTVTKQANAGNVHTGATFLSHVLSKIGEVRVGNEQKTSFSQCER